MGTPKRHLLRARGSSPSLNRAACGLRAPPEFTTEPDRVTCLACRRTLYMADLEVRRSRKSPPRNEKRSNE